MNNINLARENYENRVGGGICVPEHENGINIEIHPSVLLYNEEYFLYLHW